MKNIHKHIFIVDDDEFILWTLKARFEKGKYKVTVSSNADDAYFKANVITPSIVLIDILLPGMNGLDLMHAIHSGESAKIPIVIMSSLTRPDIIQKAYALGARAYLTKPFSMNHAFETVSNVIAAEKSFSL